MICFHQYTGFLDQVVPFYFIIDKKILLKAKQEPESEEKRESFIRELLIFNLEEFISQVGNFKPVKIGYFYTVVDKKKL